MSESLSNLGSENYTATEEENITGTLSSILTLTPDDGLMFVIRNVVDGHTGVPIYAELRDSNGDDLPLDTDMAVRYQSPQMEQPQVVSFKYQNLRPYRTLSLTQQQDAEFRQQVRHELKAPALQVRDIDDMEIALDSDTTIDWANSRVEVGRRHVDIVSKE
jgi:hypothetical protein